MVQNMGEFESVEPSASVTNVTFRDRKTAEKFYYSLHGKELPGVDGKLELSWVNTPLPPVNVKTMDQDESSGALGGASGDAMVDVDAGGEEKHNDGNVVAGNGRDRDREERTVNMDYEVGEEYAWGE